MKSRATISAAIFVAFVLGLLTFAPIARAVESLAATACTSTSACIGGTNKGTGSGVLGTSAKGYGIVGKTTLNSTGLANFKAGLLGQDNSTTGKFNLGVWGTSTRGDAVLGQSTSGAGVAGTSSSSVGVDGTSKTNTGVFGLVSGGTKTPTGVFGQDNSSNTNGAGVAGQSKVGSGVIAVTTGSGSTTTQALLAAAPNGGAVFVGVGPGNYEVATIDGSGNLSVAGAISSSASCSGCARGRALRTYTATSALPTIEDTGEATLTGGGAFVRLDPAFASAIDRTQGYYVLITPEGDTRGLYVASRTASGFTVRENFAGRSSVAFAYRIVAHPYGNRQPRLPMLQNRPVEPVRAPVETADHTDAQ